MVVKGEVIGGSQDKVLVRKKSSVPLEIGELLMCEGKDSDILLQVYNLELGSQMSDQTLQMISGMNLEDNVESEIYEEEIRNYTIAVTKPVLSINKREKRAYLCKEIPAFFSRVREVSEDDLMFIRKPSNAVFLGNLRSGSRALNFGVLLDGEKVFSHHLMIAATTGRGKSNLAKVVLWSCIDSEKYGILVLDPHDEYYGRNKLGLKDHPSKRAVYYSVNTSLPGTRSLSFSLKSLSPMHFRGVYSFSDPQWQAINAYHRKFGDGWVEAIAMEKELDFEFNEATLNVVRRRIMSILDLNIVDKSLEGRGVFHPSSGESTVDTIIKELEEGKVVVVDTSTMPGDIEILIGSLISSEVLSRYRYYKRKGVLREKPVISILIEEAPRVLGREVLERGPNIFSTIAREGRKFRVGISAITQLPSLIPRQILANINTKIIMGLEMAPERQAIIESASHDLSSDARAIASLDVGEAIISSNFSKFAIPVKVPLFEEYAKKTLNKPAGDKDSSEFSFEGMGR